MSAELHSRIYALLADRSSMPDGDVWEHGRLRRLAADLVELAQVIRCPNCHPLAEEAS